MSRAADSRESPQRLGRYLLCESLGAGGMGEVYRARFFAAAGVEKDLCVKRIRVERLTQPGAVSRFIDEARVSMRLSHAAIVPVFDFGRAGDEYYLAMEWVDGADLSAIMATARERHETIPPEVAAHVGAEVARALSYAHELDEAIVHRDVKPANVLVSRSGDVKLTDFGVATAVGLEQRSLAGTRAYMAPEQRQGQAAEPGVDLYALGVLLAEMTTGQRPAGYDDLAVDEIEPKLRSIIADLLAVDPGERPASAREVALQLEEYVGRARASGGPSPRDELSLRASRTGGGGCGDSSTRELGPDASFVRDGDHDDFVHKMTGSTASVAAPAELEPPSSRGEATTKERPGPLRRRRIARQAAAVLVVVALGAAGLVWLGARPVDRDSGVSTPTPASERRFPAAATPAAEPETAAAEPEPPTEPEMPSEPAPVIEPDPPRRSQRPHRSRRVQVEPTPEVEPEPVEPARLNINAVPWAAVYVGDQRLGVTPLFGVELPPGDQAIRFVNEPLGVDRRVRASLAPGERRDLVVDLR